MPFRYALPAAIFLVCSAAMIAYAGAASPDAWAAFRRDVEASCRTAGAALIDNPAVTVDPFGSESYGLAVLTGKAVEDGSARALVCIYDKVRHTAEIGGAMALQKAGAGADAGAAVTAAEPAAADLPAAVPAEPASPAPAATAAVAAATAPASPEAEAALADRFASFPNDPEEPAAPETETPGAAAPDDPAPSDPAMASAREPIDAEVDPAPTTEPEPAVSPENQPVVTPPVPILPNVPAPAGQTAEGEEKGGEGVVAEAPAATTSPAGSPSAAAPAPEAETPPVRFAGCASPCAATLSALAAVDQKSLADLPFEIDRTIARNATADLAAGPAAARSAAGAMAANLTGRPAPSIAAPTAALAGERSCVLYYFGYSNQAARTVGRHRCSVTSGEGGALVVEKISGEHLRADVKPLTSGVSAFVGRTFKAGQSETRYDPQKPVSEADKELGNSVGIATASEGRLMLASSELRRFEGEDNFFWVLAIDPK